MKLEQERLGEQAQRKRDGRIRLDSRVSGEMCEVCVCVCMSVSSGNKFLDN